MPALIDIRRRIRSVKSTQKVTKAMKMVSAAKLRRAQEAIFAARPFARKMMEVLNRMASRADAGAHPLLDDRGEGRVLAVVITADKGLCGAFNANIIRTVTRFLAERPETDVQFSLVGRKGRDFFRRREVKVRSEHVGVFQALRFETAREIAADLIEAFTRKDVDRVFLVHNEFKSVIQQPLVIDRILPIERHAHPAGGAGVRARLPLRARARRDLRRDPAQARRGAGVAGAPRVGRRGARGPDDRDGRGHQQRHRADRPPDPAHEQGPAGGDHQGDHRGRLGRGKRVLGEQETKDGI